MAAQQSRGPLLQQDPFRELNDCLQPAGTKNCGSVPDRAVAERALAALASVLELLGGMGYPPPRCEVAMSGGRQLPDTCVSGIPWVLVLLNPTCAYLRHFWCADDASTSSHRCIGAETQQGHNKMEAAERSISVMP